MARNYTLIERGIADTGFFSEYLPPCFNLNDGVFLRAPAENCDLIEPYCFTMSRYNTNDARRNIFIPEIGSYVVARNYIRQEHIIKELVEFTENNDISFSPILGNDDSIMRHEQSYDETISHMEEITSTYIENIAIKIIKATGAKKVLKLDISNCYSSFYMHMIPAILLGADQAEREYNKYLKDHNDPTISVIYRKYRKLDEVIRQQNLNRTNGILPGLLYSKILAEGMLSRIDKELESTGINFTRYVDDYEVYVYNDEEKTIISTFVKILKRYGFTLNDEKTEVIAFPYYMAENLEKIFKDRMKDRLDNPDLMELFNSYFLLEKNGVKGAIRYLLKMLEKNSFDLADPSLYRAYLLTTIGNNERSLTKACSLLIKNRDILLLSEKEISFVNELLHKHIDCDHDLEVLWLLYLLMETGNLPKGHPIIQQIVNSRNELAQIMLLRKDLLDAQATTLVVNVATSWILLYELYVAEYMDENTFISRLHLNKNLGMYQYLKQNSVHFCD